MPRLLLLIALLCGLVYSISITRFDGTSSILNTFGKVISLLSDADLLINTLIDYDPGLQRNVIKAVGVRVANERILVACGENDEGNPIGVVEIQDSEVSTTMTTKVSGGSIKRRGNVMILNLSRHYLKADIRISRQNCFIKVLTRYDDQEYKKVLLHEKFGPSGMLVSDMVSNYTVARTSDIWSYDFEGSRYYLTDLWLSDYAQTNADSIEQFILKLFRILYMTLDKVLILSAFFKSSVNRHDYESIELFKPARNYLMSLIKSTLRSLTSNSSIDERTKFSLTAIINILSIVKYDDGLNCIVPIVKFTLYVIPHCDYNMIISLLEAFAFQIDFNGELLLNYYEEWYTSLDSGIQAIFKSLAFLGYLIKNIDDQRILVNNLIIPLRRIEEAIRLEDNSPDKSKTILLLCKVFGYIALHFKYFDDQMLKSIVLITLQSSDEVRLEALSVLLDILVLYPQYMETEVDIGFENLAVRDVLNCFDDHKSQKLISYHYARMILNGDDDRDENLYLLTQKYLNLSDSTCSKDQEVEMRIILLLFKKLSQTRDTKVVVSNVIIRLVVFYFEELQEKYKRSHFESIECDLFMEEPTRNLNFEMEDREEIAKLKRGVKFLLNYTDSNILPLIVEYVSKNVKFNLGLNVPKEILQKIFE